MDASVPPPPTVPEAWLPNKLRKRQGLLDHTDVPARQKVPFIHWGYRPPPAGPWDLIRSIFRIHNETGNIWSHLIGAGYFAWVGVDAALGFSRATSFEQQESSAWQSHEYDTSVRSDSVGDGAFDLVPRYCERSKRWLFHSISWLNSDTDAALALPGVENSVVSRSGSDAGDVWHQGTPPPWMLHDASSLRLAIDGGRDRVVQSPRHDCGGRSAAWLHSGFRFKWKVESVTEHMDVLCLVVLAGIGALLTEVFEYDKMVHQSAKKNDDVTRTGGVDLQRQAIFFFVSSLRQCFHEVVGGKSNATALWIFILVVASAYCCVCSVVFHLCSCTHVGVRDCTYKMDLTGIVVLIAASYFTGIALGYRCYPALRSFYLAYAALISVALAVSRRDWLHLASAAGFGLGFVGQRVRASNIGKQTVLHTVGGKEVAIPGSNPDTMVAHALDKTVYPAQWPYTARDFFRLDGSDDAEFYAEPKLVKHLEDQTLAALTRFYAAVFPKDQAFDALDICSSWISHYPKEPKPNRLAITGMNAEELKRNVQATDWTVQDLNATPKLPYGDAEFDVVTNTVSVDYLTKPLEVFTEIGRVLRPGGLAIVAFSNRCFLSKLVAIWSVGDPDDRAEVAASYFHFAGCFGDPEVVDLSPLLKPELVKDLAQHMVLCVVLGLVPAVHFLCAATGKQVASHDGLPASMSLSLQEEWSPELLNELQRACAQAALIFSQSHASVSFRPCRCLHGLFSAHAGCSIQLKLHALARQVMAVVGENHPTPITLDLKSPPVDVNAPLDARDIELVQQTFARVAMLGSNTIGRILFMNIFKIAPGAVELFPFAKGDAHMWRPGSPLEVHALKVVETVATAVSLLKDLDTLVPVLQSLGLKHVGYGVEKAHYDVVGQALIATLEVALSRHFTEPVKNAYLKVWTIVRDTMISDNYAVPVLESGSLDYEDVQNALQTAPGSHFAWPTDWPQSSRSDSGLRWGGWAQEARFRLMGRQPEEGTRLPKPDLLSDGAMALPMSTMTSGKRRTYPNRSTFQAHVCCVMDPLQVPHVLESLQKSPQFKSVRSWPYAYRIVSPFDGEVHMESDDDHDPGAGGKMLGLLKRMGLENLLLIISHWDSGSSNRLGAELFKCVTEQCKDLLKELQEAVRASFPPEELLIAGRSTEQEDAPALEDGQTPGSGTESMFGSDTYGETFSDPFQVPDPPSTSRHVDLRAIGATPPPELMYASRGVCIQQNRRMWPSPPKRLHPSGHASRDSMGFLVQSACRKGGEQNPTHDFGAAVGPKTSNRGDGLPMGSVKSKRDQAYTFITEGDIPEVVDFNGLSNEELEKLCSQLQSDRDGLDSQLLGLAHYEDVLKPQVEKTKSESKAKGHSKRQRKCPRRGVSDANTEAACVLPYLLLMFGSYGAGACFYFARWPECCWPGYFDIIGHSHQEMVSVQAGCYHKTLQASSM
ncbi:ngb2 [Symbiodinium microadriaticum]|nr:ngb2 [Symbiodinium microadriaticum]